MEKVEDNDNGRVCEQSCEHETIDILCASLMGGWGIGVS